MLWIIGICSFLFFSLAILQRLDVRLHEAILNELLMPVEAGAFLERPWTIFTGIFIHQSENIWNFLANMLGILFFGNLTALLFSQRVIAPLFISGALIASTGIWVFQLLPLTGPMLTTGTVSGASGGMMALAILSTFYMPEQIMRMYVYPLKLKFIGRAMLLFSVVAIFLKYDYINHFLHLGGALGGYIFLVILKRNRLRNAPIPFFNTGRKIRENAEVEMNGGYKKPLTDDQYNEIQVSRKEYLDHLLDKICRNGIDSLSHSELDFLEKYGKE